MATRAAVLVTLVLLVGVAGCSSSGDELCEQAAGLRDRAQLDAAARVYAEAERADAGDCATDGLAEVATAKGHASTAVAQARAAEDADDLTAARARYTEALRIDAANSDAIVGQRRVTARPSSASEIWRPAQRLLDEGLVPEARAEVVRVLRANPDQVVPGSLAAVVGSTAPTPAPAPSPEVAAGAGSPAEAASGGSSGGDSWLVRWLLVACVAVLGAGLGVLRLVGRARRAADDERATERRELAQVKQQLAAVNAQLGALVTEFTDLRLAGRLARRRVGDPGVRLEYWRRGGPADGGTAAGSEAVAGNGAVGATPTGDTGPALARLTAVRPGVRVVRHEVWTVPDPQNPVAERLVVKRLCGDVTNVHTLQDLLERAGGEFEDALYEAIGTSVVDITWSQPEFWMTPAMTDPAAAADVIEDGRAGYHQLLLGEPLTATAGTLGAPAPALEAVSAVAIETYLPGEGVLVGARCLVQVTGVVVGVALGIPLLANACVKSLAREALSQLVAETLERAVPLTRAVERDEQVDDPQRPPEIASPQSLTARPRPAQPAEPRPPTRATARQPPPEPPTPSPPTPSPATPSAEPPAPESPAPEPPAPAAPAPKPPRPEKPGPAVPGPGL